MTKALTPKVCRKTLKPAGQPRTRDPGRSAGRASTWWRSRPEPSRSRFATVTMGSLGKYTIGAYPKIDLKTARQEARRKGAEETQLKAVIPAGDNRNRSSRQRPPKPLRPK